MNGRGLSAGVTLWVAATILAASTGCDGGPPSKPNLILVLVDTLRADHTSVYGYERDTTPSLRRIAEEGLVFRSHFANAPWTKPSVASIVTGLHPSAHGSREGQFDSLRHIAKLKAAGENPRVDVLSPKLLTMGEILQQAGYKTKAFVRNYHLTPEFGYDHGYDEYHFVPGKHDDAATMRACIDALRGESDPVFVWCHLMAVHDYKSPRELHKFKPDGATPINRKAPQSGRVKAYKHLEDVVAAYDNSILFDDSLIGELFDSVKRKDPETVIAVTSDHGEEFYEHGGFEHVHTLYNELLRVPLVLWGPGVPPGNVEGLTDSIDVLPTLLQVLGIETEHQFPGKAFADPAEWRQGKAESFSEQHHRGPFRRYALIRGETKLILSINKRNGKRRLEFYRDRRAIERNNVIDEVDEAKIAEILVSIEQRRGQADEYFKQVVGSSFKFLDEYDIEHLRSLGYVR